jgi:hypothetical protein
MDKSSAEVLVYDLDIATLSDPSLKVDAHIEENADGSYSVVARNRKTGVTVRFDTVDEYSGEDPRSDKLSKLVA